jgi:hypothetical protein
MYSNSNIVSVSDNHLGVPAQNVEHFQFAL